MEQAKVKHQKGIFDFDWFRKKQPFDIVFRKGVMQLQWEWAVAQCKKRLESRIQNSLRMREFFSDEANREHMRQMMKANYETRKLQGLPLISDYNKKAWGYAHTKIKTDKVPCNVDIFYKHILPPYLERMKRGWGEEAGRVEITKREVELMVSRFISLAITNTLKAGGNPVYLTRNTYMVAMTRTPDNMEEWQLWDEHTGQPYPHDIYYVVHAPKNDKNYKYYTGVMDIPEIGWKFAEYIKKGYKYPQETLIN